MNLIQIQVRRTSGQKLHDSMIMGYGWHSIREWALNHIQENGAFSTPCVIEGFAYCVGGGWNKLESIMIPSLEN